MPAAQTPVAVGVRFYKVGKMYHFDSSRFPHVKRGDRVIVTTKRGRQMGEVVKMIPSDQSLPREKLKPVQSVASPRELLMQQEWQAKNLPALITCREKAALVGIKDVKFVESEYNFDGSHLTFFFTTDTEGKDTVGGLRGELRRSFPDQKVSMRKIGPRDVAKITGRYGACGGPRCCSTFLTDFSPVTIKMAKAQGLSLNPSDIAGMCGRLRCCLVYEYEQYVEARKKLPKVRKRVGTPHGAGRVVSLNPLKETAVVEVEGMRHEVHRSELDPLQEREALLGKAAQPCSKREGGGCDCGAHRETNGTDN